MGQEIARRKKIDEHFKQAMMSLQLIFRKF